MVQALWASVKSVHGSGNWDSQPVAFCKMTYLYNPLCPNLYPQLKGLARAASGLTILKNRLQRIASQLSATLRRWWQESPNLTQESRCIYRSLSDTPPHEFGVIHVAVFLVFGQSVYILQDLFRLLLVLLFEFFQSVFIHI